MGVETPPYIKEGRMAQYWYKKDKRVECISEQDDDKDVIAQVLNLKKNGYVKVLDRRNPEGSIIEKPKQKSKPKVKAKKKVKNKK